MEVHLQAELSRTSGLAKFDVAAPEVTDGQAQILVTASRSEDKAVFPLRGDRPLSVGIHTYLLGDGIHEIHFSLLDNGNPVRTVTRSIVIDDPCPLARQTGSLLRSHGTPLFFEGPCNSGYYPYTAPGAVAWFDRPDYGGHILERLRRGAIDEQEADLLRGFAESGYLEVESLIEEALIDAVNLEIDDAVAKGVQGYQPGSSQRIERLHDEYPDIRRLWLDERHRRLVDLIFDSRSLPCQTLTFVFGSQQDAHQDTVFLTPFPAGYMCGTWIALQDVQPGSGELVVYPGSHREPRIYLDKVNCKKVEDNDWDEFSAKVLPFWKNIARRYEPLVYRPKKGSVLIWHENLLHGGSVRKDVSLERRSIVIHSFAEGSVVYYDSSGMVGTTVRPES